MPTTMSKPDIPVAVAALFERLEEIYHPAQAARIAVTMAAPKRIGFFVNPLVVAIANTRRYGGRALIAPNAEPDDGLLDVCVIQNMSAARLLRHLPKLFTGQHIRLSEVAIYRGRRITINAAKPIPVHVDGEAIGSYPGIQFTLLPKAISVLVPKDPGS